MKRVITIILLSTAIVCSILPSVRRRFLTQKPKRANGINDSLPIIALSDETDSLDEKTTQDKSVSSTLYLGIFTLITLVVQNCIQHNSNQLLSEQNEMVLKSTRESELISALNYIADARQSPTIRSISLATVSYNHNAIRDSRKKNSIKKRNIESRLKISEVQFNRCTFDDNYARLIFLHGDFTWVKITGYFDRCRFQNTNWKNSKFENARFTKCEFDDAHQTTNELNIENTRFERCKFFRGLLVNYAGSIFQDCEFDLSLFDGIEKEHLQQMTFEGEHVVKVKRSGTISPELTALLKAKGLKYTVVEVD